MVTIGPLRFVQPGRDQTCPMPLGDQLLERTVRNSVDADSARRRDRRLERRARRHSLSVAPGRRKGIAHGLPPDNTDRKKRFSTDVKASGCSTQGICSRSADHFEARARNEIGRRADQVGRGRTVLVADDQSTGTAILPAAS